MLGLLLNILNANEKYLVPHRDTLTIPIQTQLSERQKKCSVFFFLQFSILVWILKVLKKKMTLIDFLFSKLRTLQTESDKCLKVPFQRILRQVIWWTCPSTVHICITSLLAYSLITAKAIELGKVPLFDMKNFGTAC